MKKLILACLMVLILTSSGCAIIPLTHGHVHASNYVIYKNAAPVHYYNPTHRHIGKVTISHHHPKPYFYKVKKIKKRRYKVRKKRHHRHHH